MATHKDTIGFYAGFNVHGGYGDALGMKFSVVTVSGLTGATTSATNMIPAGSLVFGVAARVITLTTGASAIKIGDGTTANLFANALALTAGSTSTYADHLSTFTPKIYAAATSIVLTAVTSNFTAGAVELVLYYMSITAPSN